MPIEVETTEYTDERGYAEDGSLVEQTITFAKLPTKTILNTDDPEPEPDNGEGGGTGPTVPPKDPPPEGPVG